MTWRVAGVIGLLLLVSACRLPGTGSSCDTMSIDWVNFIHVGSSQYVAGPQAPTVLQENELGPVISRVKFKVSGNVCDPAYRPKDGDAAFLDPGTPIYELKGRSPSEALAARFNGQIVLYEVQATR